MKTSDKSSVPNRPQGGFSKASHKPPYISPLAVPLRKGMVEQEDFDGISTLSV